MSVRNRIVSKSTELFLNYGINTISTDNISLELGISKRTFYQHFQSKEELIRIIVADEIERVWSNLRALKDCDYNAVVEAIKICELELKYWKLHNNNFLRDIRKTYPDVWDLYEEFREKYIKCVVFANIEKGLIEDYYWPGLDTDTTAALWVEITYQQNSESSKVHAIQQHFIRGLLNTRGISEYMFWQ